MSRGAGDGGKHAEWEARPRTSRHSEMSEKHAGQQVEADSPVRAQLDSQSVVDVRGYLGTVGDAYGAYMQHQGGGDLSLCVTAVPNCRTACRVVARNGCKESLRCHSSPSNGTSP